MKTPFFLLASCMLCMLAPQLDAKKASTVKNVIVMIPDGCASSVLTASRWYQVYNDPSKPNLHIDPYLSGMVKTHSSNAPIGDSAPTTSAYMTGQLTRTKYISMYPQHDALNDLIPTDSTRAYQPMATLLEASRILKNKATGLVVTCYFPHATPADCASHYYNRSAYQLLARQIVYNNVDVVLAGGTNYMNDELRGYLRQRGVALYENDLAGVRAEKGGKLWGLFGSGDIPYDIDRDPEKVPSLAEMVSKAIGALSQNKDGFFMMVEGSKVDYAAHANDLIGAITEFLAFDEAVGVAMDFAEKDGNTLVVIMPDHCTGGLVLGGPRLNSGYDTLPLSRIINPLNNFKHSASWLKSALNDFPPDSIAPVLQRTMGLTLNQNDIDAICKASDYKGSPLERREKTGPALDRAISEVVTSKTYFHFSTHGHTGDDVFLACYHPQGNIIKGLNTAPQITAYIAEQAGFAGKLPELTSTLFAKHQDVFAGLECTITDEKAGTMTVKSAGHTMEIQGECSYVMLDGQRHPINSVIVYVDRNQTFYLPQELRKLM